jgi:hypothetical protein
MAVHGWKFWLGIANDNNIETHMGKGDHIILEPPKKAKEELHLRPGVLPKHKELAVGTDKSIERWFKACGIVITMFVAAVVIIPAVRDEVALQLVRILSGG